METLAPLLVVGDVAAAVDFNSAALGAREGARFSGKDGRVAHVDLTLGESAFAVMAEAHEWHNDAPPTLGGSPVVVRLRTTDAESAVRRAVDAGATLLLGPVDFAGERMARLRDPFGHLWLFVEVLDALSPEEIQRRRTAFPAPNR